MRGSAPALQVVVAVPNARLAGRIAAALLERRLCACAQTLGPITSRYRWQGKLETAREVLLVVKTRPALFAAVERAVCELHPYEVPEIAALPLGPVHSPFLAWLRQATRAGAVVRRRPRSHGSPSGRTAPR